MQNPKSWKYFAYGVAISACGAVVAEVVRDLYRKYAVRGAK
ncbi:hypothetical protein N482_13080 [Pseudoalteromonas luteoviolacea NCIMB 1942]|uniref:Uncharacterized protein n=1 Tax=Pseudoalteromonas luteoviolacea NCIMB 1942 TaxID=1365253 RepID=A0A162A8F6_9GAMM|nr:hypothetical protein N482_13080 [Pseudoalteromonas luteoviolacea NCIMB 1942]